MALACTNCGSTNTQVGLDQYQCLDCGKNSTFDGEAGRVGPSQEIKDLAQARIDKDHAPDVVGNFADLQRAGAPGGPDTVGQAAKENPPAGAEDAFDTKKSKK